MTELATTGPTAYIFPGQGAQFPGMGRELAAGSEAARALFAQADALLGFGLARVMFEGSADELRRTDVTQPAVFVHSVAQFVARPAGLEPAMVAGHSLGEFSALVAAGVLTFADALALVAHRARAMQAACEQQPGTMAAILGLADEVVERVCAEVSAGGAVVVAANYNCPGQLVISGSVAGIAQACEALKAAGAKRALPLPVGGAFHSPLMQAAQAELAAAIGRTAFAPARCPVYQNVDAAPHQDPAAIRANLLAQLTAPVRWTQSVRAMVADGAVAFIECGPGNVLQGLVKKIAPEAAAASLT